MTRYRTIVVDPPWHYDAWPVSSSPTGRSAQRAARTGLPFEPNRKTPIPYPTMSVAEIAGLDVRELADPDGCHVYLWTTNRYLRDAFDVMTAWGVKGRPQTCIWCKQPMGLGPGGTFAQSAEFFLFGRIGTLRHLQRVDTVWFRWPRTAIHSRKPEAFLDLVETISPGPYLELFARRQRLGWDTWGDEALEHVAVPLV